MLLDQESLQYKSALLPASCGNRPAKKTGGCAMVTRREFLRSTAGGGIALGGLLGLGVDLRAAQTEVRSWKIAKSKEVPSVCPYCGVGCGQLVSVRAGKIINIEGNPESPVSRGALCPKGSATFQLVVNPNRVTKVWYRAPGATEWDKTKTLEWAMDRVAQLVKKTRDETFRETWKAPDGAEKKVNHTLGIASLGGATIDNEWNYIQAKFTRTLGMVFLENQARI
jgi:formate dehydrogenase major subunit